MRHHFTEGATTAHDEENLKKAELFSMTPIVRSAALHDLIDSARQNENEELWQRVAEVVVRACDKDDLTPQVSDHFVRDCPDEIFKTVAEKSPRDRFTYWRQRANRLARQT